MVVVGEVMADMVDGVVMEVTEDGVFTEEDGEVAGEEEDIGRLELMFIL